MNHLESQSFYTVTLFSKLTYRAILPDKTAVQEYLKASGLPHATVYTGESIRARGISFFLTSILVFLGWFVENTYK